MVVASVALLMFKSPFVKEFQFLRWARQDVSVLAMGSSRGFSSCDQAQTWNDLSSAWSACLAFGRSRQGFDPLFFPCSEHVAGSIRAFDADSGISGRSSVLLWGAASLSVSTRSYGLGINILHCLADFSLQLDRGSPCWWLSGSSQYLAHPIWQIVCVTVPAINYMICLITPIT